MISERQCQDLRDTVSDEEYTMTRRDGSNRALLK